jgi:uncharacterized protein (DUF169 family)
MHDLAILEGQLVAMLQGDSRPIAIAFRDEAPAGLARLEGTQPSGCSFWRLAAMGSSFYTVPADHYNCPIGSYTHSIPLPGTRDQELVHVLGLMGDIGYIRMEEVPAIPRLAATPAVTIYAPLADCPVEPDVVLVSGRPGRLMLLQEAAGRAGKASHPMMGRPTCMAIPAVMGGGLASSLGCVGNRVYTDLGEDRFYVAINGSDLRPIMADLQTIVTANATLATYHQQRRSDLATA